MPQTSKIDAISTRWLRVPLDPPLADSLHVLRFVDWILVEVRAGGHTGLCYMLSFDFAPALLKAFVDRELARHLVGEPADEIEAVFQKCLRATEYVGQQGLAMWATAAIDTALWDLLAKRLGVPASLLFGRLATAVPAYASGGWLSYPDDVLVAKAQESVRRGFRAVKMKVGKHGVVRDLERVRALRAGVGPGIGIMVDANQGLVLEDAVRLARGLEELDVAWLEEPFRRDDLESYVALAARTHVPLAAGEREFGIEPFRRLLERRALAVVQPDLLRVGGVGNWRRVATLSEAHRLRLAPHFYKEYDVHLAACHSNLIAIECFDWIDPLLVHPLELRDGKAVVPERPGFGVEFKPEAIAQYEWQGG